MSHNSLAANTKTVVASMYFVNIDLFKTKFKEIDIKALVLLFIALTLPLKLYSEEPIPTPNQISIEMIETGEKVEISIEQLYQHYFWHWRYINCDKRIAHPLITKGVSFDQIYINLNDEKYPVFLGSARIADTNLGLEYFFNTLIFKNKETCESNDLNKTLESIRISFCLKYELKENGEGELVRKCPFWPRLDSMMSIEWNYQTKKARLYEIENYKLILVGQGQY